MISPKLHRFRFRDLLLYDLAGLTASLILAFLLIDTSLVYLAVLPYPLLLLLLIRRRLTKLGITPAEFLGVRPRPDIAWGELTVVSVFTFLAYFSIRQIFALFAGIEAQPLAKVYGPFSGELPLLLSVFFLLIPVITIFFELHRVVLLVRLSRRWNVAAAALIVAALTALIGHSEGWVFSFFIYSVVMSLMYTRYETILAPIVSGCITGVIAIILIAWAKQNNIEIYSLSFIAQYRWLFIAGAVVSLVPVLWFIRRAWPPADWGKETGGGEEEAGIARGP